MMVAILTLVDGLEAIAQGWSQLSTYLQLLSHHQRMVTIIHLAAAPNLLVGPQENVDC